MTACVDYTMVDLESTVNLTPVILIQSNIKDWSHIASLSRHINVYSLKLYYLSSSYVMYVLQFLLTQLFRGSVYVARILRFRKHALKSHRATRITAGQDSDRACGLAGSFLCISVIVNLPPHARRSHYWIITWQMSVWLTAVTGWSLSEYFLRSLSVQW